MSGTDRKRIRNRMERVMDSKKIESKRKGYIMERRRMEN